MPELTSGSGSRRRRRPRPRTLLSLTTVVTRRPGVCRRTLVRQPFAAGADRLLLGPSASLTARAGIRPIGVEHGPPWPAVGGGNSDHEHDDAGALRPLRTGAGGGRRARPARASLMPGNSDGDRRSRPTAACRRPTASARTGGGPAARRVAGAGAGRGRAATAPAASGRRPTGRGGAGGGGDSGGGAVRRPTAGTR